MTIVDDAPPPNQARAPRLRVVVAATIAIVLLAELGVRAASGPLQEPRAFHNWEAQNKVTRMDQLSRQGGASVVFMGSSMMNAGIDPELFRQGRTDPRPPFLAAINGSDPRMDEVWLRYVAVPRLKPSTVVIGLTSRDFNDAVRPQQYSLFVSSPGAEEAMGTESALDEAERRLADVSYLVRYRDELRKPVETLRGGDPREDKLGVSRLGVLAAIVVYSTPKYQLTPQFIRVMKRDSGGRFAIGGAQTQALRRLIRWLHTQDIEVVLVNMPFTNDGFALMPGGGPATRSTSPRSTWWPARRRRCSSTCSRSSRQRMDSPTPITSTCSAERRSASSCAPPSPRPEGDRQPGLRPRRAASATVVVPT